MPVEIVPPMRLRGTVTMPGDRGLTLAVLALAMARSAELTLTNPAPGLDRFIGFLRAQGCDIEATATSWRIACRGWTGAVELTDAVPDDILHFIVPAAALVADEVVVTSLTGRRRRVMEALTPVLGDAGFRFRDMADDGDSLRIGGAEFAPPEVARVVTAWALEAVLSASAGSGTGVSVSLPPMAVSHTLRLAVALGFGHDRMDGGDDAMIELERRLARAENVRSPEIHRFTPSGSAESAVSVPGDTTLAAAVCAAAVGCGRSRVTVRDMLWEPGRRGFFEALRRMRLSLEWKPAGERFTWDAADVTVRSGPREGIYLTGDQAAVMIPELPMLAVVTATALGTSVLPGVLGTPFPGRDVYSVLAAGLERMGVRAGHYDEGMILQGCVELKGTALDAAGSAEAALALAAAAVTVAGKSELDGVEGHDPRFEGLLAIVGGLADGLRFGDS